MKVPSRDCHYWRPFKSLTVNFIKIYSRHKSSEVTTNNGSTDKVTVPKQHGDKTTKVTVIGLQEERDSSSRFTQETGKDVVTWISFHVRKDPSTIVPPARLVVPRRRFFFPSGYLLRKRYCRLRPFRSILLLSLASDHPSSRFVVYIV